jgi:tripartite ATP-independent transporter DctP family solute receptor
MRNPKLIGVLIAGLVLGWSASTLAAETILLRLGHAQPTKDVFHLGSVKFKEALEQKTQGRVKVQIFPSGQLGSIRDMIEGLRVGTIQVVMDAPSRLSVYTPLGDVFKLPYLVETRAQGEKVWVQPVGQKLLKDIAEKSGITVVGMAWRGGRHITANREIRTPEHMTGLKIRVPPYDLPVAMFKALGASPTPMDWGEVYMALQQGIIDAQENPMSTNFSNRLYEVSKFLILTGHIKDFAGFMMGRDYFGKLPADIQAAIVEAAVVGSKFIGDFVDSEDAGFIKNFANAGVKVIEPDVAKFRAKLEGFVGKFSPDLAPYADQIAAIK